MGKYLDLYNQKKIEYKAKMDYYNNPGMYGYPSLSEEEINTLKAQLDEILYCYTEAIETGEAELSDAYFENKSLKDDRMALDYARAGMSMHDVADESRTLSFDINGKTFKKYGDQMSSRQRMTIATPDGRLMTGYFTEKTVLDAAENRQLTVQKYNQIRPDMVQFFKAYADCVSAGEGLTGPYDDTDIRRLSILSEGFNFDVAKEFKKELFKSNTALQVYSQTIFDDTKNRIDTRNVALKNVAELLGIGEIIPETYKMKLVSGNQTIEGSFMEEVKGECFSERKYQGSNMAKLTEGSFDDPKVLKQLTDLSILDYICGNVDRHQGNIMMEFAPDNPGKVIAIKGIDNDLSFGGGTKWDWSEAKTDIRGIRNISQTMAETLRKITPEDLKKCISGLGLESKALSGLEDRYNMIMGKLDNGKLRVIPDEAFKTATLKELTETDVYLDYMKTYKRPMSKNLFTVISDAKNATLSFNQKVLEGKEQLKQKDAADKAEQINIYNSTTVDFLNIDIKFLKDLSKGIADAQKNVHGGSPEYDTAESVLHELIKTTENLADKGMTANADTLSKLQQVYDKTIVACDAYLEHKGNEAKYREGSKPYKRIQAVKLVKEYCTNKSDLMSIALERIEFAEAKKDADSLQLECMTRETAVTVLKGILDVCRANPSDAMNIKGMEQIRVISKFVMENGLDYHNDLNMTQEEIKEMKSIVSAGMKASAEASKGNDAPEHAAEPVKINSL